MDKRTEAAIATLAQAVEALGGTITQTGHNPGWVRTYRLTAPPGKVWVAWDDADMSAIIAEDESGRRDVADTLADVREGVR